MTQLAVTRRIGRGRALPPGQAPVRAELHVLDGKPVGSHDHEFIELAVIVGGDGQHQSIHGIQPLRRGDAVVLRPGEWHAYLTPRRLKLYNCYIGPELLDHELAWAIRDPAVHHLLRHGPVDVRQPQPTMLHLDEPALRRCVEHLRALCKPQAPQVGLLAPIARLLLILEQFIAAAPQPQRLPHAALHPAVVHVARLLESQLAHPWSLDELADRVALNPSHLVRLFRAQTGQSPMAYLSHLRARRAAALLLRTSDPVGQIGAAVGWDDPNYFARRFRAHWECSPSEYRLRHARPVTDAARL